MDRFSEIDAFVQIARSGSISAAAQRLNIAKSAVSRRLSELEARLGVQLFNRTTRRVTLTEAGSVFLSRASALLDDLAEAEAEASAGQTELVGKLKVAAPLSFGLKYLQPVLSEFIGEHPNLDLEIDFSDRKVDLIEEGFDVAVRIGALADSSLVARKLCPVRQAAAAAPSFWKEYGLPKHPSDLERLPSIRYSNVNRPEIINYWAPGGQSGAITAKVKTLANNGEFLTAMAIDGHGYLVEPTFFLVEPVEAGLLQTALEEFAWTPASLFVLYPPTRRLSQRVRVFIDALVARFHNNPYWDERISACR